MLTSPFTADSDINSSAPEYQVPSEEKQIAPILSLKFTAIFANL